MTLSFQNRSSKTSIFSDFDRLMRVLVNLISNSIKFTEAGCITIVIADCEEDQRLLKIAVKDTGTGIETNKLS